MEKIPEEESLSRFRISSRKKEIEQFLEESREEIESEKRIKYFFFTSRKYRKVTKEEYRVIY